MQRQTQDEHGVVRFFNVSLFFEYLFFDFYSDVISTGPEVIIIFPRLTSRRFLGIN